MFICVPMCVFLCQCGSICVSLWVENITVCDCVSVHAFVCVCLCLYTHVVTSLGVALRGRGLPIHSYLPVTRFRHWYPVEFSLVIGMVHTTKHHHSAILLLSGEGRGSVIGGK